jgi:hypothetical protein
MKKTVLIGTALALTLGAASASAAGGTPNAGSLGLSIDTSIDSKGAFNEPRMINGRYLVKKDFAVLFGAGLGVWGADAKGTDIGFMVGGRYYFKNEDISPFMGGRFLYASTNDSNLSAFAFLGEAGAEYFLNKQFSLEGRVGFGYASIEQKPPLVAAKAKSSLFGTSAFTLGANFYF